MEQVLPWIFGPFACCVPLGVEEYDVNGLFGGIACFQILSVNVQYSVPILNKIAA